MAKRQNWKDRAAALSLEIVDLNKEIATMGNAANVHRHAMESAQKRLEDQRAELAVKEERVQRAEKDRKDTIDKQQQHYADWKRTKDRLKAELYAALENVSRQQGYIDRTLEDDAVREVGVIAERTEPPRSPRHGPPPPLRVTTHDFSEVGRTVAPYRDGVREEKPWFGL